MVEHVQKKEAEPKRWVVYLSGGPSSDPISSRKIVEAPSKSQAGKIALDTWGQAVSASVEGLQEPGKWRACEFLPWSKGQQILQGKKRWDICYHSWHENPALISPCPECGVTP
jgi:hypothetical protein